MKIKKECESEMRSEVISMGQIIIILRKSKPLFFLGGSLCSNPEFLAFSRGRQTFF